MAGPNRRGLILTFDAFGTLIKPRKPISNQYREEALKFGVKLEGHVDAELDKSFMKAYNRMKAWHPNHGAGRDGIGYEQWWKNVVTETLKPFSTKKLPHELGTSLVERFSSSVGYELYPDVLPFLSAVTATDYPPSWRYPPAITRASTPTPGEPSTVLGILSNGDPRISLILESLGIGHYFSFQTLSYEAGSQKPSREIFRIARQTGLRIGTGNPNLNTRHLNNGQEDRQTWKGWDYVHVGDDLNEDWCAARKLNFLQPFWIDRTLKWEKNTFKKLQKAVNSGFPLQMPNMAAGMVGWANNVHTEAALLILEGSVGSDPKSRRAVKELANSTITDLTQLIKLMPPIPAAAETLTGKSTVTDPDTWFDDIEAVRKAKKEQSKVSAMERIREVKAIRALKRVQKNEELLKAKIKRNEEKIKRKEMRELGKEYSDKYDRSERNHGNYARDGMDDLSDRNNRYERPGKYGRDERILRTRFRAHGGELATSRFSRNESSNREKSSYRVLGQNYSDKRDENSNSSQSVFSIRRVRDLAGRMFGNSSPYSERYK